MTIYNKHFKQELMLQVKQLDFTGQKIFCGIDVHKKSWKVCIRSEHMELKTFSQGPSATELVKHLRRNYPLADYKVVYEAGFCGFSAQREFSKCCWVCGKGPFLIYRIGIIT
jgi:transposase